MKLEWADYAAVQAWCGNQSGIELTCNLSGNVWPQSSQLAVPLWTDPGSKSGISVRKLISTSKKKKAQPGNEWLNTLPKILTSKEKATTTTPSSTLILHGGVYARHKFLAFNTGQFVSPFLNRRAPRGPPFCQKSTPADVRAVIGCSRAARRTKIGPVLSFPYASPAAVPQPSNALWRGALSSHTGKIPQSPCRSAVAWRAAVAVAHVCGGP